MVLAARDGRTRLAHLFQDGALRIRLPRVRPPRPPEAVVINTAGGVTGGDRLSVDVDVAAGATAVVTSQACEKVYRSGGGDARLETRLRVGPAAGLAWLPQPSILFDRGRLHRTLDVEMAADARLLAVESLILGRGAMRETVRDGFVHDAWRIRRDGRLVLADALRLDGPVAAIAGGPACLGGAVGVATVVMVAPEAGRRLDAARAALAAAPVLDAGASAWNGMLVCRLAALDGQRLTAALTGLIETLRRSPMPRVWQC